MSDRRLPAINPYPPGSVEWRVLDDPMCYPHLRGPRPWRLLEAIEMPHGRILPDLHSTTCLKTYSHGLMAVPSNQATGGHHGD